MGRQLELMHFETKNLGERPITLTGLKYVSITGRNLEKLSDFKKHVGIMNIEQA
jgi:hypothetical protein